MLLSLLLEVEDEEGDKAVKEEDEEEEGAGRLELCLFSWVLGSALRLCPGGVAETEAGEEVEEEEEEEEAEAEAADCPLDLLSPRDLDLPAFVGGGVDTARAGETLVDRMGVVPCSSTSSATNRDSSGCCCGRCENWDSMGVFDRLGCGTW